MKSMLRIENVHTAAAGKPIVTGFSLAAMLAASTPAFAGTGLPSVFLGRFEERARDCSVPLELRDNGEWIIVKTDRLEFFEGVTDRIRSARRIGPNRYELSVRVTENDSPHNEHYVLSLDSRRNLVFEFSGGMRENYFRCTRQ